MRIMRELYCILRNRVKIEVAEAKKNFYVNQVHENRNNPKKLWKTLKSLGTSKKGTGDSGKIGVDIVGEIFF